MPASTPDFIVFEGIDGSGKTTLSKRIHRLLREGDDQVIWLSEPSSSPWGRKIRRLAGNDEDLSAREELDLFVLDRRWNVDHNIQPALERGDRIIMDRYYYSTACYQGARGIDFRWILQVNRTFAPEPDRVYIIDIDIPTALDRISRTRSRREPRFERAEFLERVRANYLRLRGDHIVIIDGSRSLDRITGEICEDLGVESG